MRNKTHERKRMLKGKGRKCWKEKDNTETRESAQQKVLTVLSSYFTPRPFKSTISLPSPRGANLSTPECPQRLLRPRCPNPLFASLTDIQYTRNPRLKLVLRASRRLYVGIGMREVLLGGQGGGSGRLGLGQLDKGRE